MLLELFGIQGFSRVMGIMYMMQGSAAMIGTPVAGLLIRKDRGIATPMDFLGMAVMVSVLMFAAACMVAWVRFEAIIVEGAIGKQWQWKWKLLSVIRRQCI